MECALDTVRTDIDDAGGVGGLLKNPDVAVMDMNTIRRAFKERWPIPPERRQRILTVLQQIVETDTFDVQNSKGDEVHVATMPNHRNQVAAAKAILAAAALDQADMHHLERVKADEAKPGATTNVLVFNIAEATPPPKLTDANPPPPA
jgi:hypothetical protein